MKEKRKNMHGFGEKFLPLQPNRKLTEASDFVPRKYAYTT